MTGENSMNDLMIEKKEQFFKSAEDPTAHFWDNVGADEIWEAAWNAALESVREV